jgi:hypothetical protein
MVIAMEKQLEWSEKTAEEMREGIVLHVRPGLPSASAIAAL